MNQKWTWLGFVISEGATMLLVFGPTWFSCISAVSYLLPNSYKAALDDWDETELQFIEHVIPFYMLGSLWWVAFTIKYTSTEVICLPLLNSCCCVENTYFTSKKIRQLLDPIPKNFQTITVRAEKQVSVCEELFIDPVASLKGFNTTF